jgi:hypothetical protein
MKRWFRNKWLNLRWRYTQWRYVRAQVSVMKWESSHRRVVEDAVRYYKYDLEAGVIA